MTKNRSLRLKGGGVLTFSPLGFGAAPLGNMNRVLSEADAEATVRRALDLGCAYVDTAPLYGLGLSEARVGRVLAGLKGDRPILSTKVGRLLEPCAPGRGGGGIYVGTPDLKVVFDYSHDGVMRSFEESLRRLGVDRVDILYVHDIDAMTHGSGAEARRRELLDRGGWRALSDLRASSAVSAIGIGVNACAPCIAMLREADPDLFLLAGRYTLLDQEAAFDLMPACEARGVGLVLGGPFNSGILATGAVAGARYDYAPAGEAVLARTRKLEDVCAQHSVRLVDAALQFTAGHPDVLSVIPGGQTPAEVEANVQALATPIPADFWAELRQLALLDPRARTPEPVSC